ncbi:cobalamin-dependent protein [Candidatus Woesearchaeota archaeon]|nr:cobalamin-dependent protein [Candidatus Woesearchaeota archaeon]
MREQLDILYIHPFGKQVYDSKSYYLFDNDLELKDHNAEKYYSFIPMGLIGTLNKVRAKGYKIKGVNLPFQKSVYGFDLESYLREIDAKIVLIDLHWYVHLKNGLEVAKLCKSILPKAQVIVGGMTASIFANQLIKLGFIDYVVMGDSEQPFSLLVDKLLGGRKVQVPNLVFKEGVNPISYCSADIDEYNYVDIDFMADYSSYLRMFDFWLLIARGCSHDCSVCDGSKGVYPDIYSRDKLIVRDALNVARDIKKLENHTDIVALSHDLDMLGKPFWSQLLKYKFKIGVRNEFFQLPSIDLIKKLADSFEVLDLAFSPIAGSDEERRKYGKNFTNKDFLGLLEKIKDIDFNGGVTVYFSDYMISQLKVDRLNSITREELIQSIKEIHPYAVIEVQHQVVDPMVMIKKHSLEPERVFESLI